MNGLSHGWSMRAGTIVSAILLCSSLSKGADYYVAPGGSNGNDGLTPLTPFATIGYALTKVRYGDTIYLRGGTYREGVWFAPSQLPLLDPAEASWENMLTIQNYADEVPVIKGSVEVTDWQLHDGSIWTKPNWTVRSQQAFEDGQSLQQIGWSAIVFTNANLINPVGTDVNDMYPGTFYCDVNLETLYVWLSDGGDPNDPGRSIEVSIQDPFHTWYDYVHVRGIHFRHSNVLDTTGGWPAVSIWMNSIFEDCEVVWCDYTGFSARSGSRILNSIFSHNGSAGCVASGANMTWSNCTFQANNYRNFFPFHAAAGIKMITDPDMANTQFVDNHVSDNEAPGIWFDTLPANSATITIKNNYVRDNLIGVFLELGKDFLVCNNLIVRNRRGIYVSGSRDCQVFNNTIVADPEVGYLILQISPSAGNPSANNTFSNNVLYDDSLSRPASLVLAMGQGNTGNTFDYNCYFATNGPLTFSLNIYDDQGGVSVLPIDWSSWLTNGFDEHSLNLDPLFINMAGQQYWPWTNSPVVSAGTDLSGVLLEDIEGAPRPVGSPFTMGAYEFVWVDSDADGIEDAWESLFGLDPQNPADAGSDPDGDGASTLTEYLRMTDPGSSSSLNLTLYARELGGMNVLSGFYPMPVNVRHGPKRNISSAVNDSLDGDTLHVFEGSYPEDVDLRGKQVDVEIEGLVDLRAP